MGQGFPFDSASSGESSTPGSPGGAPPAPPRRGHQTRSIPTLRGRGLAVRVALSHARRVQAFRAKHMCAPGRVPGTQHALDLGEAALCVTVVHAL